MRIIVVTNQKEIDKLPDSFKDFTIVEVRSSDPTAWLSFTKARENSSVEARGNSSVEAWENSSVVAWENSRVVAWENSSVEARGNSSVVAWGNSSVVAWGNVGVHLQSDFATVGLFMFAVCWKLAKGKITKHSKTATVITPKTLPGVAGWLAAHAIKKAPMVVIFKRVSKDFLTQEGTPKETKWLPGTTVTREVWNPKQDECGSGKYHAVARPYFGDEFRDTQGDRYVAIAVKPTNMYAWPNPSYPHKIAFREGKVLYECDRFGDKIEAAA